MTENPSPEVQRWSEMAEQYNTAPSEIAFLQVLLKACVAVGYFQLLIALLQSSERSCAELCCYALLTTF